MEERIKDLFLKKTAAFSSNSSQLDLRKKGQKKKNKGKGDDSDKRKSKDITKDSSEFRELRELKSNSVLSDIKEDYKPSKDYKRRESRVEPKDAKNTKDAKSKNNKEDLSKDKRDRKDQPKSKLNQDERMKLYNEALNKQIERETTYNQILKSISEKEEEIEQLNEDLEKNNNDFNNRLRNITRQINEIDENRKSMAEILAKSKESYMKSLDEKFERERINLDMRIEETKKEKRAEFEAKKKEIEFTLTIYKDAEDKKRCFKRIQDLETNFDNWERNYEKRIIKEDKDLDVKINEEEEKFLALHREDEDKALRPFYEENMRLLNEKAELVDNFDDIKQKIITRNQTLKDELVRLRSEKLSIEENTEKSIIMQTNKLEELLKIEKEAKEKIKGELENYRMSIMKIREKNLKMKYDLSILKHTHGISKPYIYSYYSELPTYAKVLDKTEKSSPKSKEPKEVKPVKVKENTEIKEQIEKKCD